jgi:iron complex transport system substrate-binding protein
MVSLAGGECVLGTAGEKSYRVDWEQVHAAAPDVVVCAPCGYGLEQSTALAQEALAHLPGDVPVWAVDANASFARPGPRLVDGVEALAGILHPEVADAPGVGMAQRIR